MFGLYGRRASRESVRLLRDSGACGVLLLARNIDSPSQTRALTEELVQRLGRPLLFCVDHEGGWVLRFRGGLTAFPGNAALGRSEDPALAYATGRQMALELGPLGIRLNLAPVLDVSTRAYNPGIGIRSFGSDAAWVARLGTALIKGMQDHGVAACAKHFPGKGAATVDAHVELPTIRLPRKRFEEIHLAPFAAAVKAGAASIMTSHVRFPALDKVPATFSEKITTGLLRRKLGFKGVIISDDLCMGAVTTHGPVALAAQDAFRAGHDILLVAHEPTAQRDSVDALRQHCAGDAGAALRVKDSRRRIELLIRGAGARQQKPDAAQGARVALLTAARAVEVVRTGGVRLPLEQGPMILFPDFSQVSDRFTFEGGPAAPERAVLAACRSHWTGVPRLLRVPVLTGRTPDLEHALAGGGPIVFFCFEARRFPGQAAILRRLRRHAERTVLCLIRSSWDLALCDPRMTVIDAHGYRNCQLTRILSLLKGKI